MSKKKVSMDGIEMDGFDDFYANVSTKVEKPAEDKTDKKQIDAEAKSKNTPASNEERKRISLRMRPDIETMMDQIISLKKLNGEKMNKGAYAESLLRPQLEAELEKLRKELKLK